MKPNLRRNHPEAGVALILALLILLILSVLAAAIIFVSQSETWASSNHRAMMQARYAAEAGAQRTLNYLRYTPNILPTSTAVFDAPTTYPLHLNGKDVILSAMTGVSANYPVAAAQTGFAALKDASVPGLGVPASYEVTARLVSMQNAGTQMWEITSQGNVPGIRNAQVQVVMRVERNASPLFNYGITGLGNTCGDITFTGGTMDSWNSAAGTYAATKQNTGGDIATNGNVTLSGGSTRIGGNISDSSNTNVGNCPNGITNNVGGTPWGGLQSVAPLSVPDPPPPSPMTPNTNINANSNTCWTGPGCTVIAGPAVQIAPGNYGNLTSNSNLHLSAGTYNFNSLSLNGGSLTLDSYPVVINLGGNGISSGGTLFTSNSSTTINSGGNPANLMIESAAGASLTNPPVITMNSSSNMFAVVYAPHSYVHITGSSHFLGAAIGKNITSDSSGGYSYDLALRNNFLSPAPYYPISFAWSKF